MWIIGVEKFKLKTLSTFVYTECLRLCREACFAITVCWNCSVPSRPMWRAANTIWVKWAPPPSMACMTVIINNTQENSQICRTWELCILQSSWNNQSRMGSFILNKIMFMTNFSFTLWRNLGFLLPYWAKYKHPCVYKSSRGVRLDSSAYIGNWGTILGFICIMSKFIFVCKTHWQVLRQILWWSPPVSALHHLKDTGRGLNSLFLWFIFLHSDLIPSVQFWAT